MGTTRGIVFFIYGESPVFLMTASIWMLRRVYDGPLHVLYYETNMELISRVAELPGVTVSEYQPDLTLFDPKKMRIRQAAWVMKAHGHMGQYPYDVNLYYDLDHMWYKPIDMSIFNEAEEHGVVNPWAHYSKPSLRSRLITSQHVPPIPDYRTANGGCVCAVNNHPTIREWLELTQKNIACKNYYLYNNPEETALGILMAMGKIKELDKTWSAPPGKVDDTVIAGHHSKGRYVRDPLWREEAKKAWKEDFLGMDSQFGNEFWYNHIWRWDEIRAGS